MLAPRLAALWLLLDREFGAAEAMAQMGLPVVLLKLDALNRMFGIALLIALIADRHLFRRAAQPLRGRRDPVAGGRRGVGAVRGRLVQLRRAPPSLAARGGVGRVCVADASSGASGARLLIWHGLEGLLFLVGVAFQLSAGAAKVRYLRG